MLTDKAASLGLGQEFLKGIAADQPAAFLKLMVDEKTQEGTPLVLAPTIVPEGGQTTQVVTSGVKNHAFYNELKKKDKVYYWSTAVQNEIYAAAKAQGPAFYE